MRILILALVLLISVSTYSQSYPRLTAGTEETHATITVGNRYSTITYRAGNYVLIYDKTGFRLKTPTRTIRISNQQGITTVNKFWEIVYSDRAAGNKRKAIALLKTLDR